jgi:hypothetical protein
MIVENEILKWFLFGTGVSFMASMGLWLLAFVGTVLFRTFRQSIK